MRSTAEISQELTPIRHEQRDFLKTKEVELDGKVTWKMNDADLLATRNRNARLEELNSEYEAAKSVELAAALSQKEYGAIAPYEPPAFKTEAGIELAKEWMDSDAYKSRVGAHFAVDLKDFDTNKWLKTTMTRSAGYAPFAPRLDKLILTAMETVRLPDVLPSFNTSNASYKYMEETTFDNQVGAVAEAGTYPESGLAYTERTIIIEKIATFLPVTDEQLDDVDGMQDLIERRLNEMMRQKEEYFLLNGSGTTPEIQGFLTKSGVNTASLGSDSLPDAVFKLITDVRTTGFVEPDLIALHPDKWETIRLMKTTTGIYIWGSPAESGVSTLWGKPVLVTTAMPTAKILLGAFRQHSRIARRKGITMQTSNSHSDWFIKGKLAIRAEERLGLEIDRATAFGILDTSS